MILANVLFAYIYYVYKFGCGFIHLSGNHGFQNEDPFEKLNEKDKISIAAYLNQYHGFSLDCNLTRKAGWGANLKFCSSNEH